MRNSVSYNFSSILASELYGFLYFREANGHCDKSAMYILRQFDAYLVRIGLSEKVLNAEIIDRWLEESPVEKRTKCVYISVLRQLSQYLSALGISAFTPTSLRISRNQTPYVLSHDEIQRFFEACDNLEGQSMTNAALWFPVMARMIYGCGLRVGEAVSIQNKDIDWTQKTLTIRAAKGNKDRLVPMSNSLCEICASYYVNFHPTPTPDDYFFYNHKRERFPIIRPYMWMRKAYEKAGIDRNPDSTRARGICVHTLRHTFAVHTLQSQSDAGIDRFYAIPILSTYMGHNDIYGTELYLQLTPEYHETIVNRTASYVGDIFPEVLE